MRGTVVGAGLLVLALVVGVVLVTTAGDADISATSPGLAVLGGTETAVDPSGVVVAVASEAGEEPVAEAAEVGLGPVSAALDFVAMTGDLFGEPGIISRTAMVTDVATDRFGPALKDSINSAVTAYAVDARTSGVDVIESPITVAAVERSDGRWDVSVWSVLVMSIPSEDVGRSLWRTSTFTMALVDGEWLVDDLGIESGPQPAPFAAATFSDPHDFEPVIGWTPVASVRD